MGAICGVVTGPPELRERSEQLGRAARLVPRAIPVLTATPGRKALMADQARMGRMAGAALRERRVPKAPPVLMEPKGRKVVREIAKFPLDLIEGVQGCDH